MAEEYRMEKADRRSPALPIRIPAQRARVGAEGLQRGEFLKFQRDWVGKEPIKSLPKKTRIGVREVSVGH